ncbi:tetratricopeptide repeat protein [Catenovulum sediminis]|uniref:tetratricopeptide repeat protein n=1 Tax=Catenovulum sediminis TaxID=1740262 RepID=UPI00117FA31A|nr:sel1 repeat family protein [Catenovulum sediminis]
MSNKNTDNKSDSIQQKQVSDWDELPDLEIYDDDELSFIKKEQSDENLSISDDEFSDLMIDDDMLPEDESDTLDINAEDLTIELAADFQDEEEETDLDDIAEIEKLANEYDQFVKTEINASQQLSENASCEPVTDEFSDSFNLDELADDDYIIEDSDNIDNIDNSDEPLIKADKEQAKLVEQNENELQSKQEAEVKAVNSQFTGLESQLAALTLEIQQLASTIRDAVSPVKQTSETPQILSANPQKLFATGVYYAKHADYIHAAKWFRRAALAGHGKAMFYLGMMFIKGEGLPQSVIHSYVWMSLAKVYEVSEAKAAMTDIQHRLTAHELNQAQRIAAEKYEEIENQLAKLALQ